MMFVLQKIGLFAMLVMHQQSMAKTVPKAPRSEIVAYSEWNCGATDFEKPLSHQMSKEDCPKRMFEADLCCRVHDMCYMEENRTREYCDDSFCYCLERTVAQSAQNANQTTSAGCTGISTGFCEIVKLLGGFAYTSSRKLKAKQDKAMATLEGLEEEEKRRKAMASSSTTENAATTQSSTATDMASSSSTTKKAATEPTASSSTSTTQMPSKKSSTSTPYSSPPSTAAAVPTTTPSPAEIGQFVTHKFPLECFDETLSTCTRQLHQCVSEQYSSRQNDAASAEDVLLLGVQFADCSARFCACTSAESARARQASVPRWLLGAEQCAKSMAHICAQFEDVPGKQYRGASNVHFWSVSVNYTGFSASSGLVTIIVLLLALLLALLARLCSKTVVQSLQKRLQRQKSAHKNYTCRSSIRRETLTALRSISGGQHDDGGPHYLPLGGKESTVSCPDSSTAASTPSSSGAGDDQCPSVLDGQHLLCPHNQSPKYHPNSNNNRQLQNSSNKQHKKAHSESNKPLALNSSQVHLIAGSGNSSSTLSDASCTSSS